MDAPHYVERGPKPPELFSRGPHDATATFDIGNPNLAIETAKSIEAGLRRAVGPRRFEVGNNLLNDDIRNSVSYTKDEVLLPGRSVRVFANLRF